MTIAEDSNDIYILSGEHPDQLSPPSSLLCTGDNSSEQSSWKTESLPVSLAGHESWAQVGGMDPEDVKSLDSNEGVTLAEEQSENNSSNSDIVHVEREDAELLEEAAEVGAIEESMMSVLGTESELAELREECMDITPPVPVTAEADTTAPTSLLSLDEPVVIETSAVFSAEVSLGSSESELLPPDTHAAAPPSSESEPPAVLSVPAVEPESEPQLAAVPAMGPIEVPSSSPSKEESTAPAEPEATADSAPEAEQEPEPFAVPPQPQPETPSEPQALQAATHVPEAAAEIQAVEPPAQLDQASERHVLLYGGAALVVLAAVIIYSVVRYRRK